MRKVLFKTKSGIGQGMGDVTSSIVLAEEFRSKKIYDVLFITNVDKGGIDLIKGRGFKCHSSDDINEIGNYSRDFLSDISILNQLDTPINEAKVFKDSSRFLVTIEDTKGAAQLSDLRFNVLYPIDDALTDFKFMPLARSFQDKHAIDYEVNRDVTNILVIQGGSDTHGFIPKIIRGLYNISAEIKIKVIIGPNFSYERMLFDVLSKSSRDFVIVRGEKDLSRVMMDTDLAISAAGNTLFELACLGIPTVVVCGEYFEVGTAQRLQSEGFGINLGFGKDVNEANIEGAVKMLMSSFDRRLRMSIRGRDLIDGQGVKRIVSKIEEIAYV